MEPTAYLAKPSNAFRVNTFVLLVATLQYREHVEEMYFNLKAAAYKADSKEQVYRRKDHWIHSRPLLWLGIGCWQGKGKDYPFQLFSTR